MRLATEQATESLRATQYNATVIQRIDVTDDLYRIRVRPDHGFHSYEPGQYVAIGLGFWEPRIQPSQNELVPEEKQNKLVRRAYSISCPMLDASGNLLTCNEIDYLELYIALVRGTDGSNAPPPALTPRLFLLNAGDRLNVATKISGHYTLEGVELDDNVLMISTGTGEAPHNAMTAELLARGHRGKVIQVTTVRRRNDLGYLAEHRRLMARFSNYRYLPITTREPENLESSHPKYVGKQYVQQLFLSGELAKLVDDPLSPVNTHAFLCGNPTMIGFTPPGAPPLSQPGMIQVLESAGYSAKDKESVCGHIRFEKYW
ncbi:MAG TPA: ferredoxin--NADP reductase [Planctomycetaceae bacterium]|nr:ferredoxin--NADP reductase [Planctomycetaceae bacterium]